MLNRCAWVIQKEDSMTNKLPSGEAIRAGEALPLDLEAIKQRLYRRGTNGIKIDHFDLVARDIPALIVEVERLRASSGSPDFTQGLRDAVTLYAGDGVIADAVIIEMAREHARIAASCRCEVGPLAASDAPERDTFSGNEFHANYEAGEEATEMLASPRASAATPEHPAVALLAKMKLPTLEQLDELDDDQMSGIRSWPLDSVKMRDIRAYLLALSSPSPAPTPDNLK
jgi:hypothetical protein